MLVAAAPVLPSNDKLSQLALRAKRIASIEVVARIDAWSKAKVRFHSELVHLALFWQHSHEQVLQIYVNAP